ncbi:MAG: hypothetical protein Phog2KO_48430 [Phototrophicaceae bacterium]
MSNINNSRIKQQVILLSQAKTAMKLGNKKDALRKIQQLLKLNNRNTDALLLYAELSPAKENSVKALERILTIEPNHTEAYNLLKEITHEPFKPKRQEFNDLEFERMKLERERLQFEKEKLEFEKNKRNESYSNKSDYSQYSRPSSFESYSFDDPIQNTFQVPKTSKVTAKNTERTLGVYRAFLWTPGFIFLILISLIISFYTYGLPVIFFILIFIKWYKSYFTVTNKRIILTRGNIFFGGNERTARLEKITDITVNTGFWGSIFDYGQLFVETSGSASTEFSMKNIKHAKEVKQLIEEAT